MEQAVVVENLTKSFRAPEEHFNTLKDRILIRRARHSRFVALDQVSLSIGVGESVALIGNNGSGKSTLLKCIGGILHPDSGRVSCPLRLSALLELGAGFHPDLSGRENIHLNAALLGLSSKETRIRFPEIVDFADIGEYIDAPVRHYSSGMYARLGFAIAVNTRPEVLLVDEVLAVGDEPFQRRCIDKMNSLRAEGVTIVSVSHGVQGLRSFCDRVFWLEHGRLKQSGPAGEVIDEYLGGANGLVHAATTSSCRILEVSVEEQVAYPWSGAIKVRASGGGGVERVAIGLLTAAGAVVATWNAIRPFALTPGDAPVSLRLDLRDVPLARGAYGVSVTLVGAQESVIDWWAASHTPIEVNHETSVGEAGVLAVPAKWSIG